MNFQEMLASRTWLGVVEDNNDPERRGRVKVRVTFIHENIPTADIPFASPIKMSDGKDFSIPEKGKIVDVVFYNGDHYAPEYIATEHYDRNLQDFLENMSEDDYKNFTAVSFDAYMQIYSMKSKGMVMDYNKSNINITPEGDINHNLRDNKSALNLGSSDATQNALLAKAWMEWFDTYMDVQSKTPYLGNLGAPVIPHPLLLQVYAQYKALRPSFLSKHVWLVDNNEVQEQERNATAQVGDKYKVNASEKDVKFHQQIQKDTEQQTESEQKEIYTPEKREEPESRSTDGSEDKNNVLQRPVEIPKSMADSKKTNTVNGKLKIIDMFLPESNYKKEEHKKLSLWLHGTAGAPNPEYVIGGWKNRTDKVATAFLIGGYGKLNGSIYRAFDEKYYANHLGIGNAQMRTVSNPAQPKQIHRNSIGIEVCNWGYLFERNGKFYNEYNKVIPKDQVFEMEYRGYNYWHKYTPEQIESLRQLLTYLMGKYGITSSKYWTKNSFEINDNAYRNQSGIWVHGNVRKDKYDMYPYPPLIEMLNGLRAV